VLDFRAALNPSTISADVELAGSWFCYKAEVTRSLRSEKEKRDNVISNILILIFVLKYTKWLLNPLFHSNNILQIAAIGKRRTEIKSSKIYRFFVNIKVPKMIIKSIFSSE
jgi:hypothetical protein